MKMRIGNYLLVCAALLSHAASAATGNLRAGAARIEITPTAAELPEYYKGIKDQIHVRVLALESGSTRAILSLGDLPMIDGGFYNDFIQQLSAEFKVPKEYILLGTSHAHSVMRVAPQGQENTKYLQPVSVEDRAGVAEAVKKNIPVTLEFNKKVWAAYREATRQAFAKLQPARVSFGTGEPGVLRSRTGESVLDPSLGVHTFKAMDGKTIAMVLNFGITPVGAERNQISGDVPGSTARYLEAELGEQSVVLFTNSAPQPVRFRTGGESGDAPRSPTARASIMSALGVVLGEEALNVARSARVSDYMQISAAHEVLQCPGKVTYPRNLSNQCADSQKVGAPGCTFKSFDVEKVDINVGVLRLGDVAYLLVDGNPVPALANMLREASPLANTRVVSTNFGPVRHMVDNAAYALNTYPATDTRAKPGCVDPGLIETSLKLIEKTR